MIAVLRQLGALKTQSALSGKQWDKGIKSLTKMGLVAVSKVDELLTVELI